ncbi:putative entry exclusion protein TrbK-alt [Sphingomonas sp. AR_OL41]|uniref:putative entry exclusion protein TrbK-alt n=1 Tax=Sphingomonas sp. AR_OL41 TaxID=3042729 RepID=UPI00247FB81D|nr:putative entry exclusion protein TrbK-alt [Sphingomonas sp. AR_OL41]MDH7973207.1 putative entry exclusion protein TrbK-alt [Sphingomonas sp. AR_OL41]
MRTSTIARIGAGAFVALVIAISALEMQGGPVVTAPITAAAVSDAPADPLRAELARCQAIGTAASADGDCLRAWAENRRRFLAPGARPQAPIAPRLPDPASLVAVQAQAHGGEAR